MAAPSAAKYKTHHTKRSVRASNKSLSTEERLNPKAVPVDIHRNLRNIIPVLRVEII
jgi:hypothetical protein